MKRKQCLITIYSILFCCMLCLSACSNKEQIICYSEMVDTGSQNSSKELIQNPYDTLSVPTQIMKFGEDYFIVDCYHNQVIYHDNLEDSLSEWQVMTSDITMGHTIASDGTVYLVDDTENHRVLIFEKENDAYVHTQTMNDMGIRPHYIQYHSANQTFYVWSSMTGEMFLLKRNKDNHQIYLSEVLSIPQLNNVYVRSFTIDKNQIYFVTATGLIVKCKLNNLEIIETYQVPDQLAGMIQLTLVDNQFFLTVSTDIAGNQDAATIIQTEQLENLSTGNYTDVYHNFIGGGTPYYISSFDNTYYLTEHRLPGHSIWNFQIEDGQIKNPVTIY